MLLYLGTANTLLSLKTTMEDWLGGHSAGVKRGCIVMESGANMLKSVCDYGFVDICCMVHIIHLMVQDALGLGGNGDGSHSHSYQGRH